MQEIWNNISTQTQTYGPRVLAAIIILVGFIVLAYIVRWLIAAAVNRTAFARKANETRKAGAKSLGASLSSAAFWIIILIGVVQALTQLQLTTVTDPLNAMLGQVFAYLPRILGAILVLFIFLIVASVVSQTARAVLVFADPVPQRMGLTKEPANISGITATVLGAIIIAIGAIAAIDALDIQAISGPATDMLQEIVAIIPNAIAALIILGIFLVIARFVTVLLKRVLPGTGLDAAVSRTGLFSGADSGLTASTAVATVAGFFIVLTGLIAALRALDMPALTAILNVVLDMAARIAFGAVIIFAGVFIARIVSSAMASAGSGVVDVAASVVKWAIIVLAAILGISRMGLDPEGGQFILDAARIVLIGAALAMAIAFGWGGRDWAARQLERLRASPAPPPRS